LIFKVVGLFMISVVCFGQQKITDVPASDAAYPAIKRSVDKGYFTLMDGNKFLPEQGVNRKELALLLDRLDELTQKASLSAGDIIELKSFSKQFKGYMESQQNAKGFVDSEVNLIKTEQKTINYDISRVEDHIQQVEKTRKEQELYIWLGVGLGVLGLMR